MKPRTSRIATALALCLAPALMLAVGAGVSHAAPADNPVAASGYPAEVALSEEGNKGFVFRRFPGSQRLYTYDLDKNGRSACNNGCYQARPPVLAPADAKAVGDWTVIRRDEGENQWAYKGHPVYTLYHDDAGNPQGDGEGGVWHLLPYMKL